MAEYIDRERVLANAVFVHGQWDDTYVSAEKIKEIPAADVAPVVHGRWEFLGPNRPIKECMCGTCSVCKVRSKYIANTMLCPNCGARMDAKNGGAMEGVNGTRKNNKRSEKMLNEVRAEQQPPFMKIPEASKATGLSQYFLRIGCKDGSIPHIMCGNNYLINVPQFLKKLEEEWSHKL